MNMKPQIRFAALVIIAILFTSACNSPAPVATAVTMTTQVPAVSATETSAPTTTVTSESSFTPTPTLLPLEILEWHEWPYTDLVDPTNTDTHVEALIRNPNDVPVRVNHDLAELRFINVAGEAVYVNPNPVFHIWQSEWMLPGETAALSACVCFWTSGIEKQGWESLKLVAPLEVATDISYTLDVEVKLGKFVDIAAAHLGGGGFALETTLTNTSDQPLASIAHRVLARDANGRYVGVAFGGNAVVKFNKNIAIQPGDTATGLNVIEINYFDGSVASLTYEVAAIGIPYEVVEATAEALLPSGTPLAEWNGIPIMPGAIAGEDVGGAYQYTIVADLAEITAFYETEFSRLGFEVELQVSEKLGQASLSFQKEGMSGTVYVVPVGGGLNGVAIILNN